MSEKIFSYRSALTSARKANYVTNLIRGKNLEEAVDLLEYDSKKASKIWQKLLKSALVSFEGKKGTDLIVTEVYTGVARGIKKGRFQGRGGYHPVKKRRSNLYVKVVSKEEPKNK